MANSYPYVRIKLSDNDNECEIKLVTEKEEFNIPVSQISLFKKHGEDIMCDARMYVHVVDGVIQPRDLEYRIDEVIHELKGTKAKVVKG